MNRVLAMGFFDGVHIGHGRLFRRAAARAKQLNCRACALTYDSHPQTFLTGRPVPLLCSTDERAALIRSLYKLQEVIIDPFDAETASIPWREYLEEMVIRRLKAVHVVVGHDFTFGRGGDGTPELLAEACRQKGLGCDILPPKRVGGTRVSSTYIRGLVAEGDMESAARFLGHRYRLSGLVERGRGLGRSLGFPTANLPLPQERQFPAWGVYATLVGWNGRVYPAATNVGIRPTVGTFSAPTVESTLLDFDRELYGERIDVDFLSFLRPERRFETPEALTAQVLEDLREVRRRRDV
ncbi:MAG: riboflavin biosynthesis protein RibF [Oscillospiraceae bacterium]|jgi:riboflavin kinase/FMN adenylyltransferase|nr:riboflavin biosynthesis protein RibF [Oscillospiraceae bacterium]